MNLFDVAAGIGQGIPTAIQSVGTLANIASERERLALAKETAKNTQTNEEARLAAEQSRLGIATKQLGLAETEAVQKTNIYNLDLLTKQRENEEQIRLNTPSKDIMEALTAFPGGTTESVMAHKLQVARVEVPEAFKRGGMATPKELKRIAEVLQSPAHDAETASLLYKDWSIKEQELQEKKFKIFNIKKFDQDKAKHLQESKTKINVGIFKNLPNKTIEQQHEEWADAKARADRQEELNQLDPELKKLADEKMVLAIKHKKIQEALIAQKKEYATSEAGLLQMAGEGIPSAVKGVEIKQTNAMALEEAKEKTKLADKSPQKIDAAAVGILIKDMDENRNNLITSRITQTAAKIAELEKAVENIGTFSSDKIQKKALEDFLKNPAAKWVKSHGELDQDKLDKAILSPTTHAAFLTKEEREAYSKEKRGLVNSVKGIPTVGESATTPTETQTKVDIKVPSANGIPLSGTALTVPMIVETLKQPGMTNALAGQYKAMLPKEDHEKFDAAIAQVNATPQKGKISNKPIQEKALPTPRKEPIVSNPPVTIPPGISPGRWNKMTAIEKQKALDEWILSRKKALPTKTIREVI